MVDLTGRVFGRLTGVKLLTPIGVAPRWLCECSCGNFKEVRGDHLTKGDTKSCGCLGMGKLLKHGHRGKGSQSKTYTSWTGMKNRCDNPKDHKYPTYGAVGITYDPRWTDFENFISDMGERPEGKTLDRLQGNLGYSKDNCRWATPLEQSNNRKNVKQITYQGKSMNLAAWCRELKISYTKTLDRITRQGKTFEEAIL